MSLVCPEGFDELAALNAPNLDRFVPGTAGQLAGWQNNQRGDPLGVTDEDSNCRAGGSVEHINVFFTAARELIGGQQRQRVDRSG